jgi:hypothetical protein
MRNFVGVRTLAFVIAITAGALAGAADPPPPWAFAVNPPGAQPAPDDGTVWHVPASTAGFTRTQLRDLYKKHHWQVAGPTFYQLHLLFDKHAEEQNEIIDLLAERVQSLGGIAVGDPRHVAQVGRGGDGVDLLVGAGRLGSPERSIKMPQRCERSSRVM